jgi:hypothetical protein
MMVVSTNNLFKTLLIGISFTFTWPLLAQEIIGRIENGYSKQAISNANIVLYAMSGNIIANTVSKSTGTFDLHINHVGHYRLRISFVGFRPAEREITIDEKLFDIGTINLFDNTQNLKEVIIRANSLLATQHGDTTVMNASAYKTNPDATVQDLVQKMPGIVMQNGKLQAQGEEVKQVLVDGKEFFKNDISAALTNLPASIVKDIQVYDAQSDQSRFTGFDDGNRLKTINIITTTGVTNSQFGRMYAGGGLNHLYSIGESLNLFHNDRRISVLTQFNNTNEQSFAMGDLFSENNNMNAPPGMQAPSMGGGGQGGSSSTGGGISDFTVNTQSGITKTNAIGLNYSDQWGKKIKVDGNYFFNYADNNTIQTSNFDYTINQGQTYQENKKTSAHVLNHRFNLRLDYTIDAHNSLFFRPSISFQQSDGTISSLANTDSVNSPLSSYSSLYTPSLKGMQLSGELLYRHQFKHKGRTLSLDVNSTNKTKNGHNYMNSLTRYYTNNAIDTLQEYADLHANGSSFSANVSYTEPLTGRSMLMVNYMYGYQESQSHQKAYNYNKTDHLYDNPDSSLTNSYHSIYSTNTTGVSYLYHKKDLNFNAQLSYQYARLTGENELSQFQTIPTRYYNNILPSMMLRYNLNGMTHLEFDYRPTASAPSINQLQEVVDNSNPTQLTVGNNNLSQVYQHNFSLRLISPQPSTATIFMCFLNGSLSNNYIGNNTFLASSDTTLATYNQHLEKGSQLTTYDNMSGYYNFSGMIGYGFPFIPLKTNIHVMFNTSVSKTPSVINNQKNLSKQTSLGGDLIFSSNISENVDFLINGRANYTTESNSLHEQANIHYWNLNSGATLTTILLSHFILTTNYSFSGYFEPGTKNELTNLLNCSIGYKFLHKNAGDLRFLVNDILNQNTNFSRSSTSLYTVTNYSNTLGRHFMFIFTYTLKHFSNTNHQI